MGSGFHVSENGRPPHLITSKMQTLVSPRSAGPLLSRYDALICDVWGVVHDGVQAYAAAGEALARFRGQGGTVVLLSNSPMPSHAVVDVLDEKGVRRDVSDAIVTSGDIAQAYLADHRISRIHHIGAERDLVLFRGAGLTLTDLHSSEAIVCTGLVDDIEETGETYRPLLEKAHAIGLPFLCANPDLVVDVGGLRLPCAGTLAALYESIGGEVIWAGKPHAVAFERAFETIERLRGERLPKHRILAIGDALGTDIAGAARAGLDIVFIAQGIHHDEIMEDGRLVPERLARFIEAMPPEIGRAIIATMPALTW